MSSRNNFYKTNHYNQNDREVRRFFNKKFEFKGNWTLPLEAYKTEIETIDYLIEMKNELNCVKSQLNDFPLDEWSKFTKYRDPSGSVIKSLRKYEPEILTQAWCKFYEILSQYDLLPRDLEYSKEPLQTLHLCEAPGGFISALNHFLAKKYPNVKWEWMGSTLNPFHEGLALSAMIPDDRLIRYSVKNWNFGIDNTGDITKFYNYISLVNDTKDKKIKLITADGSIDCLFKPEEQESIVYFIHFTEVITALSILKTGGNFVIKMFTMFEQPTISLVYLLNCAFNKVIVHKPCTSKHGNSEVYILCLSYKGKDNLKQLWSVLEESYENPEKYEKLALFTWDQMGDEFLHQIKSLCDFFKNMQVQTINDNVSNFMKKYNYGRANKIKNIVSEYFLKNCSVVPLVDDRKLINPLYFKEIPEFNRFCFHNRFWKFRPEWIFDENYKIFSNTIFANDGDLLELKLGKSVCKILYSPYYSFQNFSEFNFENFRRKSFKNLLYNLCKKSLCSKSIIINMSDLADVKDNKTFQKCFFEMIFKKLDEVIHSLIFVHIPFVTNFMVSLLFILSIAFKKVVFIRSGCVVLINPDIERIKKVKKYLNILKNVYHTNNNNNIHFKFDTDILQVISPLTLEKNDFYKYIWNYNNSLCTLYFNQK